MNRKDYDLLNEKITRIEGKLDVLAVLQLQVNRLEAKVWGLAGGAVLMVLSVLFYSFK